MDLLNKGLAVREIAKEAPFSFTDIKKIRMKLTGEVDEGGKEKEKPLSFFISGHSSSLSPSPLSRSLLVLDFPMKIGFDLKSYASLNFIFFKSFSEILYKIFVLSGNAKSLYIYQQTLLAARHSVISISFPRSLLSSKTA